MNYCPCCKDTLLSHISHNHVYWFCPSCWQEMPVSALPNSHSLTASISEKLSINLQKIENPSLNISQSSTNDSELATSSV
ncbi:hypothetical protein Riv7116_3929 [Rivularia sp. PCC 7116]|uniref:hypothetical protein n=1 Tax=Rivularia sp. PCC 7116 TaxID=373994 RepID=UPI00029ECE4A|nr:hypothetical protein [Rivularia sp. PCC 7116]AFY56371.1 hypothetical protein Riv7116_3929 [Rivularia sp. PCC 7116]